MVQTKSIDRVYMRGNFSSHAGDYDNHALVQKRVVVLLHDKITAFAKSGLMLDVGTGTGALAAAILCSDPSQQLVVMDIAHGMTREAAKRLPAVTVCDGDARYLPFADDSFANVVSSSVYQWVDCLPTAFAEVARVLKPGGRLILALFGDKTLYELRTCHCQAIAEGHGGRLSHVQSFPAINDVSTAIDLAGLSCYDLFSTMEVEYHADVPDLLRQLKQIGASNASLDRPRGLAPRRVMQSMMRAYEESFRCDAGVPASYEVIIAVAEKPLVPCIL
ncbi:MAG: methyltransferase domain-containing protein [Desulfuromonadales bacterium]|nr:methyltransferase domain-containing protein [Desulfuromonadales bacterium]